MLYNLLLNTPDVLAYNKCYPFGMLVPNRNASSAAYRYGFNSMEKDDEIKGIGNSYDFGARMLDSRIGRWFATDSKPKADQSNYVAFINNPIIFVDPDGKDDWYFDFTTKAFTVIRNGKPNRYFITDYIYTKPTEKGFSFGHPQNKQYSVNSDEIKQIFTQNAPLWNKALGMYPMGSDQKREIWNTMDTVDEAAVIMAVMSPLIPILAIEAAPFLAAEATLIAESGIVQSTLTQSFTSLSSSFALNSGKMAAVSGGVEFGTQYLSNVLINNDFSLGNIDFADVALSSAFTGSGSLLTQSFLDLKGGGFELNGVEDATMNFIFGKAGSGATNKFNSEIGTSLSNFSPSMGSFLQGIGLIGIETTTKAANSQINKDKSDDKN